MDDERRKKVEDGINEAAQIMKDRLEPVPDIPAK